MPAQVVPGPLGPKARGPTVCLPMPGGPPEDIGSPPVTGASGRGRLQLVKSGGWRPGGGGGTPHSCTLVVAVPGGVGPPMEAAPPCPGILVIIWLHVSVGAN